MSTEVTRLASDNHSRKTWRAIVALNAVSGLSQIGQFGIAFMLFPIALEAQGSSAFNIGAVSSSLWIGNLLGLVLAPRLVSFIGHRRTVAAGLFASAVALLATPWLALSQWIPPAAVCGFGYGLRWIGNETWLFGITPAENQGKVVGFHESLLAVAVVAGPALIAVTSFQQAFTVAAFMTATAAIPLLLAGSSPKPTRGSSSSAARSNIWATTMGLITLGTVVAALGGLVEGGTISMFPVYGSAVGLDSAETAWILTVFGVGAMVLQFPLGWIADRWGVRPSMVIIAAATLLSAGGALFVPHQDFAFGALMFVLGGAITGYLTLAILMATLTSDPDLLPRKISQVSIAFTIFSALGPLIASLGVTIFGPATVMGFAMAIAILTGVATTYRARLGG